MDTTYNGWTNYETWNVNFWLDNDEYTQSYWEDATHESDSISELADRLKSEIEDAAPTANDSSMYADLLGAALSSINWYEIAEHYASDYGLAGSDEDEDEEDEEE